MLALVRRSHYIAMDEDGGEQGPRGPSSSYYGPYFGFRMALKLAALQAAVVVQTCASRVVTAFCWTLGSSNALE